MTLGLVLVLGRRGKTGEGTLRLENRQFQFCRGGNVCKTLPWQYPQKLVNLDKNSFKQNAEHANWIFLGV